MKFVSNSEKQTTATRGNVESDCAIVSEMSVSNGGKRKRRNEVAEWHAAWLAE